MNRGGQKVALAEAGDEHCDRLQRVRIQHKEVYLEKGNGKLLQDFKQGHDILRLVLEKASSAVAS